VEIVDIGQSQAAIFGTYNSSNFHYLWKDLHCLNSNNWVIGEKQLNIMNFQICNHLDCI